MKIEIDIIDWLKFIDLLERQTDTCKDWGTKFLTSESDKEIIEMTVETFKEISDLSRKQYEWIKKVGEPYVGNLRE